MNQKVKLQISSDLEDVTRLSSVMLDEALLHLNDLAGVITAAKNVLKDLNISSQEDLQKLKTSLQYLNSSRIPMNKADNRLADTVAILDGLEKVLTQTPEQLLQQQQDSLTEEKEANDSVTTG